MKNRTNSMGGDIIYSWSHEEDVHSITTLFNVEVPRLTRNIAYYKWSNNNNPFGRSLCAVAKSKDKIIAHYSIMPMDFIVDGQKVTIGFGQQAIVKKGFRNIKIIKSLTDFIYEEAKKRFSCIYAFPNDNFFLVKNRLLGWEMVDVFYANIIPIKKVVFKNQKNFDKKYR